MATDLLIPVPKLAMAHLELTTRCNVRCVYCHKSFDGNYSSNEHDFPLQLVADLIKGLQRCGLKHLRVSGDGETTTHPKWIEICEQFLEAGFDLEIVCNFAKKFSPDEIKTLASFKRILVSCDTTDPDVLRNLRKGVTLGQIQANLAAIIKLADENSMPLPNFCMSIVVTDRVVFDLEKTVLDALALGFQEFFLNDLLPGPENSSEYPVKPIWAMPREKLIEAQRCLESALAIASNAGAIVVGTPGLLSTIQDVLASENRKDPAVGRWSSSPPTQTQTRSCLSPWRHTYISVNGLIRPCCVGSTPIMGDLNNSTIDQIMNGDSYRTFRKHLLLGNLPEACVNCALAGIATIENFSATIASIVQNLSDVIAPFLPQWTGKKIIVYGAGGHSQKLFSETNICSLNIIGIVDRNPKLHGKNISGISIHPVEEINNLKPDIIVISSLELQNEIYQQLEPFRCNGIETVKLYDQ